MLDLEINGKRMDGGPSFEDSVIQWVQESRQPLVTSDWNQEARFQKYRLFVAKVSVASTCTLPLNRGPRCLAP